MENTAFNTVIFWYFFGIIISGMLVYAFKIVVQNTSKSCMKYLVLRWLAVFMGIVVYFLYVTDYGIKNGAFGTYDTEEVQTDKKTLKVTTDVENKITTFVESNGTIIYEKSI